MRRLAPTLGTDVQALPSGAAHARGQWEETGVLAAHPAPGPARTHFHGHGSTNEHADLLQELAPWAIQILSAGASELRISESAIPGSQPGYALTVIVFAPAEHMPALTQTYALAYTDNPTSKALRGTGLTPTGHHFVLVKDS